MPEEKLPEGWRVSKLGEICEKPQYGWTTKADKSGRGLKLLRTTDISSGVVDWSTVPSCSEVPPDPDKYLLEPGDIVVSRAGSVGISHRVESCPDAVFASYLIRFRPTDEVDGRYIEYFLKSPGYWEAISETSSGITIPNVNASKLREIEIPLTPLPEQRRIVDKLDEIMAEIKATSAHLARAKELIRRFRQAVLNAAVTGKLTEGWRREHRGSVSAHGAFEEALSRRTERWPADLRTRKPRPPVHDVPDDLPEGWLWVSLDQIASCALGKMLDRQKHTTGSELPYLRNLNVQWDRIETGDLFTMYFRDEELLRYSVQSGDLLVCEGGEPGRAAVWDTTRDPMMYQKALHRVRLLCDASPRWLMYNLMRDAGSGHLEDYYTGSTIKHFTGRSLSGYSLRFPSPEEQYRIVSITDGLLQLADEIDTHVDSELGVLGALSGATLSKAFRGELIQEVVP